MLDFDDVISIDGAVRITYDSDAEEFVHERSYHMPVSASDARHSQFLSTQLNRIKTEIKKANGPVVRIALKSMLLLGSQHSFFKQSAPLSRVLTSSE